VISMSRQPTLKWQVWARDEIFGPLIRHVSTVLGACVLVSCDFAMCVALLLRIGTL
jgi:hypothetical protein